MRDEAEHRTDGGAVEVGARRGGGAEGVSPLPPVVDAAWVAEHLGETGLLLADVRGPNAHTRGHLPGSIPLVLGSPAPVTDRVVLEELASEVGLRLRRHGVTGGERLVLYDGGDCIGACASYQLAALAGHPTVAVMAGGLKSWGGDLEQGVVELDKNRNELDPQFEAVPTVEELAGRLGDPGLTILDVRRADEFAGKGGYPCDPRQGHIPGAQHLEAGELFASPGMPLPAEQIRAIVGLPEGAEIVAYCHSGSRSALAAMALRSAGYRARNYTGSWHEWSRHDDLPMER
jgi:thiosulfate/3-mercaptopyruvate sulfurtransferase